MSNRDGQAEGVGMEGDGRGWGVPPNIGDNQDLRRSTKAPASGHTFDLRPSARRVGRQPWHLLAYFALAAPMLFLPDVLPLGDWVSWARRGAYLVVTLAWCIGVLVLLSRTPLGRPR